MSNSYRVTIFTALKALRRNLLRACLTTLGIMIGIAAVIAMVEIGQGSSRTLQRTIATMGANNLLVTPGTASSAGGLNYGSGSVMTMTPEDARAIAEECSAVRAVAPIVRAKTQVVYGNKNWVPSTLNGTTPSFLDVRDWTQMAEGVMFDDHDVRGANKVCVIGSTLVRELFQGESPIGKEVRVNNVSLKVLGVLSSKGANMMGFDQDDILLAPWTTVKSRIARASSVNTGQGQSSQSGQSSSRGIYPNSQLLLYPQQSEAQLANRPVSPVPINIDQILTAATSNNTVQLAIAQITELLRERHRLRPGEPDDFSIRDMADMIKTMSTTSKLMTTLLLCVAMISLVVGGVGIMNIMLVSVTERTREIGLRMAVGARGVDILWQFLVESIVLCLIGGAFGILLGRLSSYLITSFLSWPTESSMQAIIAAVVVSATVGIVFGFYPAWKASRMDPIEALRYE